ncbi:nonsense-mediated mRNA decay factor SMG5-like [Petaurus breviceps papuanus]|uniref:nonsense-mediated mRNA decay factor SMG5-like n=1 Tax=Petaurus breviceps papuanus TaxID=3040969 RepID=UPI0036DAA675
MGPNQIKQLLMKIVASARQLDAILARELAPQEAFQPETLALRTQIEEGAIQLILLSPKDHGVEAEDLLWRKVYSDIRKLRKTKGALATFCGPEVAYRGHLKRGIRVYHRIFFSVQAYFQLKLENYLDWTPSSRVSASRKAESPSVEEKDWALKFCHCCLLRIGDLYHDLAEFTDSYADKKAENYYYKALALIPEMGQPFVHLATLAGAKYSYVEAAYFYQCCIYSQVPHVGASLGLERIYLKTEKIYRSLWGSLIGESPTEKKQGEDVKRLLLGFLYLQSLLKPNGRRDLRLERLCQVVLEDFQLCLFYPPAKDSQKGARGWGGEQKSDSLLPNQLLFQMVVLCLLTVHSLKTANVELCQTATTFTLAFFSYIIRLVSGHIQAGLRSKLVPGRGVPEELKTDKPWPEDRWPEPGLPAPSPDSGHSRSSGSGQKSPFSSLPHHSQDSREEGSPKEVSDLDVTRDSYDAFDDGDDWGDISFCSLPDSDGSLSDLLSEAKRDERSSGEKEVCCSGTQPKPQSLQERLEVVSGEGLLPTVKVILQWLGTDPALTVLSMHTCPGLWSDLLLVLNQMPRAEELGNPTLGLAPWLQELLAHFEQPAPPISRPLPEDVILHSLLPLRVAHRSLDFDLAMAPPFSREETALRACVLRTFGHFAAQLPQSRIQFDSRLGLFKKTLQEDKTPSQQTWKEVAQSCAKENRVQQQLQKELELLEKNLWLLQAQTALSPYLIIDSLALCQYLSVIREMAQSGRFFIIIPRIVIDELDRKKGDALARHALRFIEDELKRKNRRFRCQVEVGHKFMRPVTRGEDVPLWNLYGILFAYEDVMHAAGTEPEDAKGLVTILTALSLVDPRAFSFPLKLALWTAHSAGVSIHHVLMFYTQWKSLS